MRAVTYSIIARDPAGGGFGVAVQSHFFGVGAIVPWARPGVGAVATQASGRIEYGPDGLAAMAGGAGAPDALARLLADDPAAATRQVAMVDAAGRVACHTGSCCIRFAGAVTGDGVSCQANIMTAEGVPEAMLDAFLWESGPLAHRLLAALEAAEAAGGDLRGRQSAALLVVPATGEPWRTEVSLRVEDASDPLGELGRLLRLRSAYVAAGEGDEAAATGRHGEAAAHYAQAAELAPELAELRFWGALGRAAAGDLEPAVDELRELIAEDDVWLELLGRLPAELAPSAAALRARLSAA